MKRTLGFCVIFLSSIFVAKGGEPPLPKTLEARIDTATYIFTAKAVGMRIVDEHGHPRGFRPPGLVAGRGEAFEVTLNVLTPLFPRGWKADRAVIIFLHNGGFMSEATPRPVLGKELIYFVHNAPERDGGLEDFCINSTESLDRLEDVRKQIQTIKRALH